jgi:hypothetical protein
MPVTRLPRLAAADRNTLLAATTDSGLDRNSAVR